MDKLIILFRVYILVLFYILSSNANPSAFKKLADNDELFLRTTLIEGSKIDIPFPLNRKYEHDEDDIDIVVVTEDSGEGFQDYHPQKDEICLTAGCVKVAARVIENIDEDIDPCDDFYQFACGGFQKNTFIPPDKSKVGEFSNLKDKLEEKIILMLEEEPSPTEPKIFESVRNLYKSCMDTEDIEKNSVDDLKNILKQVGGYPVVEGSKWDQSGYNSNDLALKLDSLGFWKNTMFVSIGSDSDSKNSTKRVLSIGEAYLGLPRKIILKGLEDKTVKAYLQYLIDTAKFLGASDEAAEKEMRDVLNLEIEIAKILKPREYWRNATASYNLMTIKDVSKIYPSIQWVDLFNKYFDNENITLDENEEVVVRSPSFLKDIQDILANTRARVQANYQISKIIPMSSLSEEALKIADKYEKARFGVSEREPRWKTCLFKIAWLRTATSSIYIRKHFSSRAKEIMDEMVHNILNEFFIILNEIDWLDEETRNEALEKAHMIRSYIGYPEELLNNTLLDEYYSGLYVSPKGMLNNDLIISKYLTRKNRAKFRQPIEKNYWKHHANAATVNAFYSPTDNSIEFPAGILDGVFFGADRPLYMNYGAIGLVVGHEITHGFDDRGSQFNGHGNVIDWWDPETKKKYLERTGCVIEKYGNYSVTIEGEEIHLDGINTQGENIADFGGIKEAYRAYQRLADTFEKPEGVLPGLPYSQNQLFWLAGADVHCSASKPDVIKEQILLNAHTPDKFRVNGPFSNFEEFSNDWSCPIGSKMNPAKKCHVW